MQTLKTNATQLIVIDSRVTDWQSLIGDITANATLLVLDPLRDGLTQIAEAVASSANINAIHIISHGNVGSLLLGSTTLNSSNLIDYQAQLSTIGDALSTNGDILLYGCDVAQGNIGQQFITQLSSLTGADIAASTDLTGAVNQGGNWVLEAQTSTIETTSVITDAVQAAYQGTLATTAITGIFSANDGINGVELWVTDGTAGGTHLLKDINKNPAINAGNSSPLYFSTIGNNKVVFNAIDGINGQELWVTDGTSAGTNLVKDIYKGSGDGNPQNFASLGNGLALFSANNLDNGQELWVTDGTVAGTKVLDINTGSVSSSPYSITSLGNGKALFGADDVINGTELWITDGTTTSLVKDINLGANASNPNSITSLGNNIALFRADDGINGTELWIYNGTTNTTSLLKDIYTGFDVNNNSNPNSSNPDFITSLGNGTAVFTADDGIHGTELWVYNSITDTASLVNDINIGVDGASIQSFTSLGNGKALFSANDGVNGAELWIYDSITDTASLVNDINVNDSSNPSFITSLGNGKALFAANDGTHGKELWITDGSLLGTLSLGVAFDLNLTPSITSLGNGKALFNGYDGVNGTELWIYDDTTNTTSLVKDINPLIGNSEPSLITLIDTTSTIPPDLLINENFSILTAIDASSISPYSIPNSPDPSIYSLVSLVGGNDTDNNLFTIDINGQLQFKSSPNYEAKNRYNITVRIAADSSGLVYVEKSVVIGINDVNEEPTDLTITKNNINENVAANSVIGTLNSIDPDAGNTFTYSFVTDPIAGVDNSAFTIVGDKLQINSSPDFETKSSYNINVRTTDQGNLSFDKALTITINNLNENFSLSTPPTANYTDTAFVDTFTPATGTLVATTEPSKTLTYGITGGTGEINTSTSVSQIGAYGTLTVNKTTGAYSFVPDSTKIEPLKTNPTDSDSSLNVTVSDGSQTISNPFTVVITQSGTTESNGNDVLTGTGAASNNINSLAGNDTLDGGASDVYNPGVIDRLNGGAGDDTFLARGFFGAGIYDGGDGSDTLDFSQADSYTDGRRSAEGAGVAVDMTAGLAVTYYQSATNFVWLDPNGQIKFTNIENVRGTAQNDIIVGDSNANSLEGGAGNDTLIGKGGNDTLVGGTGNDTYIVDSIGYTLTEAANAGSDTVQASINFDLNTVTNIENLTLTGTANLGTGDGLDNSLIGNNSVSSTLNGGAGNDTLDGGVSDVYNPTVTSVLNGGDGNDTFVVQGFFAQGVYDGGAGTDTLDFNQADTYTAGRRSAEGAGVAVDMTAGLAISYYQRATGFVWADPNGHISFSGIENVRGTTQSDVIVGDGNDNTLDGGVSDVYNPSVTDILYGGAGNDTLLSRGFFGFTGFDGGTGSDWIDFSQSDAYTAGRRSTEGAGVAVDLKNGLAVTYYQSATNFVWNDIQGHIVLANVENVRGSTQNDVLVGSSNDNILDGGAGNDTLYGGDGADTLIGGLGKDTINLAETTASTDTVSIAIGDSLVTSYDLVYGFGLGTGSISTTGVDNLHLATTLIAATGTGDGTDVGTGVNAISSHSITNGIISFDSLGAYDTPVAITAATNLANVFSYLQANIGGNETVAFVSEGNTFVFQDGGATDTLVELVGVTALAVNTTGSVTGAVWLV